MTPSAPLAAGSLSPPPALTPAPDDPPTLRRTPPAPRISPITTPAPAPLAATLRAARPPSEPLTISDAPTSPNTASQPRWGISRRNVLIAGGVIEAAALAGGLWLVPNLLRPAGQEATIGTLLYTYQSFGGVIALAWSSDSSRIASVSDEFDYTVNVWDATTGGHAFVYRGHSNAVYAVAWSPDGARMSPRRA